MTTDLAIALVEGVHRLDSRLLAERLGYDHKVVLQSIRRHRARLEARSVLLQNEAKPLKGSSGGRPELFYLLDERQCLILAGSLKKGVEADDWHDRLVDAFLHARERVRELEAQQMSPLPIHTFTNGLRERISGSVETIPDGTFSVPLELLKHLYNLEALLNSALDQHARLEISVGGCWGTYAREVLGLSEQERQRYAYRSQDGRVVSAWAYPIRYVTRFDKWLWNSYFPAHFPAYCQSRPGALGNHSRARSCSDLEERSS